MKLSKALQSEENLRNYESKTVQILITFWRLHCHAHKNGFKCMTHLKMRNGCIASLLHAVHCAKFFGCMFCAVSCKSCLTEENNIWLKIYIRRM